MPPAGEVAKQSRSSPACRAAVKRREWVRKEVEKMEEEREAHWRANARRRGVKTGQFAV